MLKEINYDEGLPVKLELLEIEEYPWHFHNDMQLVYVMEGEIALKLTYENFTLEKDSLHLIHPEDVHGFKGSADKNLLLVLSFDTEFFLAHYPDLDSQIFTTKVNENIATYKELLSIKASIFSIILELENKESNYKDKIKKLSFEIIDKLYSNFRGFTVNTETHTIEHQISYDAVQMERVYNIVRFVYKNYPYKLVFSDIAKSENLNMYYLSHLFQQIVGNSFRDFVSTVRVEISERLLLSTNLSIAKIAQAVGFSNAKYYTKNFEIWFGSHPKKYRELNKYKILGYAEVKAKEQPLTIINNIIKSQPITDAPIAKQVTFTYTHAETVPSAINVPDSSAKDLYKSYDYFSDCLSLLENYFSDPFHMPEMPPAFDTKHSLKGLFTFNNIRKPIFYVYDFIRRSCKTVRQYDNWYAITESKNSLMILFVNKEATETQNIRFEILDLIGTQQITEYRLASSDSCFYYWKRFDFKNDLSESEKQYIENKSAPQISQKTVNTISNYSYLTSLAPHEIVFVEITSI